MVRTTGANRPTKTVVKHHMVSENETAVESDICVVTQPLSGASEAAAHSLVTVLSALTGVSLVTANVPSNSELRTEHEIVEITQAGTGKTICTAGIRYLKNQLLMCSALRRRTEGTVLFFGTTSYVLPILYSRLLGKTVILEPRGNVPHSLRIEWERTYPVVVARFLAGIVKSLENIGYWLSDGIITLSPSMASEMNLNRFHDKLYPNGAWHVELDGFNCTIPYEDRNQIVGYLGRLGEEKGIKSLVSAVKQLPPDIDFVFIGDGALRSFVEEELAAEIKSGRVEITGWVDHKEVPAHLNELRLLVLPSKTEGLPTTILESLACGTPVYATPVGGVPDLIADGETGYLMEESDPDAVADRIEVILSRDDIDRINRNAQKLIEQEYVFGAAVNRYRNILTEIEQNT